MVEGMPRPRPPHLHKEFYQHDENRPIWYVRVNKGPRIRLRSEFGTDAFWKEYHAAVDGGPTKPKPEDSDQAVTRHSWLGVGALSPVDSLGEAFAGDATPAR